MSDKKPWGDDYVPDNRPWPNALLPTEDLIQAGAMALDKKPIDHYDNYALAAIVIEAAMRALAKPDELKG